MKCILFLILFLSSNISFGQYNLADRVDSTPFIDVVGTAEKEVVPDEIFVSIILKDKTVNKENYSISVQEEKLKSSLQKLGFSLKNLYLADMSSAITQYKRKETGIEEKKEFVLKVSSANEVSKVFEELSKINIKEAYISRVNHTNVDMLRKEVRIMAVKAAKDKATYLLAAIGEELGKPIQITETTNNPYIPNYLSNSSMPSVTATETETQTDFEKFKIKFSYNIRYAIK